MSVDLSAPTPVALNGPIAAIYQRYVAATAAIAVSVSAPPVDRLAAERAIITWSSNCHTDMGVLLAGILTVAELGDSYKLLLLDIGGSEPVSSELRARILRALKLDSIPAREGNGIDQSETR